VITNTAGSVLAIPIIALTVRDRGNKTPVPQEDPEARQAAREASAPTDIEGVFVVRNGIARFVPVQIGIAGREHFEVISGLSEGDSVIAGPYEAIRALKDGDRVKRMAPPAAPDTKTAASK
jgi:HlyD family secretion protein